MITIETGDPHHPDVLALLEQSHAMMEALFPSDENHYLSAEELGHDDVHLFVARDGERLAGTAALAIKSGYGEIKSMFVREDARRHGVADALLRHLTDHARAQGLPVLRLETGNKLNAAVRLYARHGFHFCDPFGDYTASATSLFMEKDLS